MFGVFSKGGSIGDSHNNTPVFVFEDKEVAKKKAADLRKLLTKGERQYYKLGYVVKPYAPPQ